MTGRDSENNQKEEGLTSTSYIVTLDDDYQTTKTIEDTLGLKNLWFSKSASLKEHAHKLEPMGAFINIYLKNESGLDLVPFLRTIWPNTAIIVMTGDTSDKLVGEALASGANDFIRKPINKFEVLARLRARVEDLQVKNGHSVLRFGDLRLNLRKKSLSGPGGQVTLSTREMDLMAELVRANGVVVFKDALKRVLWGHADVSDNALDRKIFEVRKALRAISQSVVLQSVYGVGMVLRRKASEAEKIILEDFEAEIKRSESPRDHN